MTNQVIENLPDVINRAEVEKTEGESSQRVAMAENLSVTDITSCNFAEQFASECYRLLKKIDERFKDAKESTHKAHKAVTNIIASLKKPIKEAQKIADDKARTWRREEQKRQSIEAEKRRKEEQERLDAERLVMAEKAEQSGQSDLAQQIISQEDVVPVADPVKLDATEGISHREKWVFEIVDLKAIPREYMIPDDKKIGQIVRALKGQTNIPGIRAYDEGTTVHRV